MSFMQVRASMSIKEKLRQVRGAICVNRREIAHTRLEVIAGADNPYSLITIFGRGHLAIKAGDAVYVTRCSPVEVILRSHKNCTEEIPVTVNETDAFMDPISYRKKPNSGHFSNFETNFRGYINFFELVGSIRISDLYH
jgi:hypothetical protein